MPKLTFLTHLLPLSLTLIAIATLLTIHPVYSFDYYAEKRFVQIIIITSLFFSILLFSKIRNKLLEIITAFTLQAKLSTIAFFSIGVISSLLSQIPSMAFLEVSNFFLLLVLSLFIASSKIVFKEDLSKFFLGAFIACAISYLVAFIVTLVTAMIIDNNIYYIDLITGVTNRRFLNQFQSISFPLLLIASLLFCNKKITHISLIFLAAFWFMLMILSDGRGVLIGSLTGIILSGLLLGKTRIVWWKHSFLVMGLGIVLYLLLHWLLSFYSITTGNVLRPTTGGRSVVWLTTLSLIKDSPLLGIGPMQFAFQSGVFENIAHPHNIILQLMSEWGIPATLLLVSTIIHAFWKWIKQQQKVTSHEESLLSVGLTSAFIATIVHGQFSGVFVMPLSQLAFVLISGWMIGTYFQHTKKSSHVKKYKFSSILLISITLIALSSVYYALYQQAKFLKLRYSGGTVKTEFLYQRGNYPAHKGPRYWKITYINEFDRV